MIEKDKENEKTGEKGRYVLTTNDGVPVHDNNRKATHGVVLSFGNSSRKYIILSKGQ